MLAGSLGLGLAALTVVPGPAYASIPKHPAWESSAKFGAWHNHGFIIYNNEWNTSAAGPQTIWADSFHHFGVQSKQADTTSVKTYPCVQKDYNNPALSRFTSLGSSFTQSMPRASKLDAEAAYDLWLNNYKVEVMMWVDNHGQTPAGHIVARTDIFGREFAVWQSSSSMFSFVLTGKQLTSGHAHLLSALRWLVKQHDLSSSDTMTQVNFGWEIASTNGKPMDFTVTSYGLTSTLG